MVTSLVNTVKDLVETHVSIQQIKSLEAFIKQVNKDRFVGLRNETRYETRCVSDCNFTVTFW